MGNKDFIQKKLCVLCGLTMLCVLCGLFISCGKEKPPTGGPKDTEPPVIIDVEPLHLSTNYSKTRIEIIFSEPIDPESFNDALIIYPIILKKKISWGKNRAVIKLKEEFLPDHTYHFTIDKHCRDMRQNKLEDIYHFAFSTGDSINTSSISGTSYIDERAPLADSEIYISLYSDKDTTLITTQMSRSNENFNFTNLKNGKYILSAFRDVNNDLEFDPQKEPFAEQNISLDSSYITVDLSLSLQDTIKPSLKEVIPKSRQHLLLECNEDIRQIEKIEIVNSENDEPLEIFETMLNGNEIDIITSIPDSIIYTLFAYKITDFSNNIKKIDSLQFRNLMQADTTALLLKSYSPEDGSTLNTFKPQFHLEFNKIIPLNNVKVQLINSENNHTINLVIQKIDGNKFQIVPELEIKNYVPYKLVVSSDCVDYEGMRLGKEVTINILPVVYH
ncbi:MAG: Ig-like domain-containing protein [Candidatus Cloacimonetes bacterium]|nr:Ig-like domain-containing protein [Candidatus Cloacimonadota bacterium]